MLSRIKVALASPQALQRLSHFIVAQVLFSLPPSVRKRLFYGTRHYCPVCESELRHFLVLHRPYHLWCPVCRSLQRHRLVWLFFEQLQLLKGAPKRMLHIAPEPGLVQKFLATPGIDYVSADLNDTSAMVKMDVTDIQYPADSFDLIYCSHVLEHVPNDVKALEEFFRVLKPSSYAVLLVPITVEKTFEDPTVTDPVEREELFGQFDHVRNYGPDFKLRVEQSGFECRVFKTYDIVAEDRVLRLGLPPDETIFLCYKK